MSVGDIVPEAPVWRDPDAGETIRLTLRTITPMFGGSAKARETDDKHPIRAASIRGHLRFWWRATAGASARDSRELFQREEEIWGSATVHGRVAVWVNTMKSGSKQPHGDIAPRADPRNGPLHGVFLFPFQKGNDGSTQPEAYGRNGVEFELGVTVPAEYRPEVERAIKAWVTLGGVGSRTRRGCGALQPIGTGSISALLPPNERSALHEWLVELAGPVPVGAPEWSTLSGAGLVYGNECAPLQAWRDLGKFWSRFRKGHFTESHPEYNPLDGGKWRDHDRLRNYRGEDRIALAKPLLGLPTIYQDFPSRGSKPRSFSGTLESAETSRMASPVLLKPVFFADGRTRPVVVVLRAPQPRTIRIDKRPVQLEAPVGDPVLASLGNGNALRAAILAAKDHFAGTLMRVG